MCEVWDVCPLPRLLLKVEKEKYQHFDSTPLSTLKGAVLRDNARGNNFVVVRVVWVKHRTFNGRFIREMSLQSIRSHRTQNAVF